MIKHSLISLLLLLLTLDVYAVPRDGDRYTITVKDDNDNSNLPKSFRSWYYHEFVGLPTNTEVIIKIKADGWKGGENVIPVYSYYGTKWHRFERDDIFNEGTDENGFYNYSISKKFKHSKVIIARYYPYSIERLEKLEARLKFNKYFHARQIGLTAMGRPIKLYTITDFSVPVNQKKAIWIHSRTHPSETGSSFVAEGLMEYLLKKKDFGEIQINLKELVFYIVPMVNPDGVDEGNSRVTPLTSIDLERQWIFDSENPKHLHPNVAIEARVLNNTINQLNKEGNKFVLAINLHSTNSTVDTYPFIFTNFSVPNPIHGQEGDSMFVYHLRYAYLLSNYYCGGRVNVITSYTPSKPMNEKTYPESWWWVNFKSSVVAFTLESAVRHLGCYEAIVNYKDQLNLGEALAVAIQKYNELYYLNKYDVNLKPYDLETHKIYFINNSN